MRIYDMEDFQHVCRACLVDWYNDNMERHIEYEETFVAWSVKVLQNFKALCSTTIDGDGIYAEFTYNGDKDELYCDYYCKKENVVER